MTYETYSFDHAGLTELANSIYAQAITDLQTFDELTADEAEKFRSRYVMLVARKGIFGRVFDSWFSRDAAAGAVMLRLARLPKTRLRERT